MGIGTTGLMHGQERLGAGSWHGRSSILGVREQVSVCYGLGEPRNHHR